MMQALATKTNEIILQLAYSIHIDIYRRNHFSLLFPCLDTVFSPKYCRAPYGCTLQEDTKSNCMKEYFAL